MYYIERWAVYLYRHSGSHTVPLPSHVMRGSPPPQAGKDVALMARWRHCAISSQRLRRPVVACGLGKLYNKEAVIEALLDRSKMPHDAAHIKSLKVGLTLMQLHLNTHVCVCVVSKQNFLLHVGGFSNNYPSLAAINLSLALSKWIS